MWTAKTVKRPPQQPTQPQYTNYWAPLTCKRHTMPHPAQPQHTHWAPRTRTQRQQEHRPHPLTESSNPTQLHCFLLCTERYRSCTRICVPSQGMEGVAVEAELSRLVLPSVRTGLSFANALFRWLV